ncbi:MAG TPA: hypothetical protein VLH12_08755 [Usitatibacter sp.]|nr:hypothetical protein [Usitatibacter sp.]
MSGSGTGIPATSPSPASTVATRGGAPFILERVTQPQIEPITLAAMKTHLRAFSSVTDLDAEITELIQGAREWVEDFTGRALIDQTWRITINGGWPGLGTDANKVTPYNPYYSAAGWDWWRRKGEILLRKSPVIAITRFVSADGSGVETAIDPAAFALCEPASKWPRIAAVNVGSWSGSTLKIEFRAGFANRAGNPPEGAEKVPARFIQAMKLWAEAHYDRDEKMMQLILDTAERLICSERSELGIA